MRCTVLTAALVATAAMVVPRVARADIFRCKSQDGSVHYTNSRPNGSSRCKVIVEEDEQRSRKQERKRAKQLARADPAPERAAEYGRYIREAARLYRLPEAFLRAVMKVESDFTPRVVSHAGAMGLMQLMPQTATAMGVRNPFDPRENILGGARYLRVLANKFNGDLVLTIAGYNAGEGAVVEHSGVPPYRETRRYVRNVLRYYYAYRNDSGED